MYIRKDCKTKKSEIYLDNNSNTTMCDAAVKTYESWLKCHYISTDSKGVLDGKAIMEKMKDRIHAINKTSPETHTILFTSGGTESNNFILRSVCEGYASIRNEIPHVITSAIEHSSKQI